MSWQLCYDVLCHHTTAISERLVPFYIIDHQCTSLYPFRVGWKAMLLGIGLFSEILPKSHWFCTPDCQPFFGHAHFMEQMRNHHVYLSMWKDVSLIDCWLAACTMAQWLFLFAFFALTDVSMKSWKAKTRSSAPEASAAPANAPAGRVAPCRPVRKTMSKKTAWHTKIPTHIGISYLKSSSGYKIIKIYL